MTSTVEDIFEIEKPDEGEFSSDKYFNVDYKVILENLAKEILSEKNGITLQELTSDIGYKHDLARTTKKQLEHIEGIIKPWAGINKHSEKEITVWASPEDVVDIIEWRGVDAFGTPREWNSLALPECLGLAKLAITKAPHDPVDFIFNEFKLSRRTKSTAIKFEGWVKSYSSFNF